MSVFNSNLRGDLYEKINELNEQLAEKDKQIEALTEKINEVLKYCSTNTEFMWGARIISMLLDCDFRESGEKARKALNG